MGQKINPIIYRIGVNKEPESTWFATGKQYIENFHEDLKVRGYIEKRLSDKMVSRIDISRKTSSIYIDIQTARPGQVIGSKGSEIEKLRNEINHLVNKGRVKNVNVFINIKEINKMWLDSKLVGAEIAKQLEQRISFRRAMKNAMKNALKDGAQGIKVQCSGRLGGAEIARTERYKQGRTPLHTLRADIDYALIEAHTTYGVIGIKVWIYKGDILNNNVAQG
ncbi:MAG: 30S ribosomal protein S3 [Candidatus Cloacimonadales bacterium]